MRIGRLECFLSAAVLMATAVAALGAADTPRVLSADHTRALVGGDSACDGNCELCGSMTFGDGCGTLCFDAPGEICRDWLTGDYAAIDSGGSVYLCDDTYPYPVAPEPCNLVEPDSLTILTYPCTCQGGVCTVDYTVPLGGTLTCNAPGCAQP